MVQSQYNLFNVSSSQVCKIRTLGEVLSDQAVCIFIGPTLPGRLRISKIYLGIQSLSNRDMLSEFFAVVTGNSYCLVHKWVKQINDGLFYSFCFTVIHFFQ